MITQADVDSISIEFQQKLKKLLGVRKRWLRNMGKDGEPDALQALEDAAEAVEDAAGLLRTAILERGIDT